MEDLQITGVATETKKILDYVDKSVFHKNGSFSYTHLYGILTEVENEKVVGTKAHRYIGWAQAAICLFTNCKSDLFQDLNRRYKRKEHG